MFDAAEHAVSVQPSLKKVVIMKQTPRYDLRAEDPLSLKPVLADIFNQTLAELWLNSQFNDNVAIVIHKLECTGGIREARYRDIRSQKYDGVHLYGPSGRKAYTISVRDILKSADIVEQTDGQILSGQEFFRNLCQFQYQKKKYNRHGKNDQSQACLNQWQGYQTQQQMGISLMYLIVQIPLVPPQSTLLYPFLLCLVKW